MLKTNLPDGMVVGTKIPMATTVSGKEKGSASASSISSRAERLNGATKPSDKPDKAAKSEKSG